jgi:hypothetical protein
VVEKKGWPAMSESTRNTTMFNPNEPEKAEQKEFSLLKYDVQRIGRHHMAVIVSEASPLRAIKACCGHLHTTDNAARRCLRKTFGLMKSPYKHK